MTNFDANGFRRILDTHILNDVFKRGLTNRDKRQN